MAAGSIIQRLAIILRAKGVRMTSAQLKGLGAQATATNGALKSLAGRAGTIAAVAGSLYAMIKVMQHATEVGKKFEQAMANLKAVSGASNNQLLGLEDTARKLGQSTRYTAEQVGFLQTEFARLGFSVDEIQNATKATLDLAAATDSDLAQAALIAGQTVRAFRLDAQDTQRVTDVMARSFTSTALTMDKFSDSMTYVAPVAQSAGFSIEGTTATLGLLTNAGISGSIAGTSLRRIFLELSNESSRLTKRLGGPVKNAHDLAIRLNELNKSGVTTAEVKKLVGLRATSAFQILMKGAEDLEHLTTTFENAGGAAQEMADIQLDTLEGKLIIMKSAWEGFGVALYDYFETPMQNAVVGMTNIIQKFNEFIGIPMTQKMNEEKREMNGLFGVLERGNLPTEKRKEIIDDINREYKDYIPRLISEKDTLDDIRKVQDQANKVFIQSILLRANEEKMEQIILDNRDAYNEWGAAILEVEKAESDLNDAQGQATKFLALYNKQMRTNLTEEELMQKMHQDRILIIQESKKVSKAVGDDTRDNYVAENSYVKEASKNLNIHARNFEHYYKLVQEYEDIVNDANMTEEERSRALSHVNEELAIQEKVMKKVNEQLEAAKEGGQYPKDDDGDPLKGVKKPTFFDDFFGIKNIDFENDFALIQDYGNQITELMDGFSQHNIDRARDEAQARIDILNESMNEELATLRRSHRFKKMSEEQQLEAEKKIKDETQALVDAEEAAANEKIKREFKVQQSAKVASIAMSTADAVMKAMAGSVFTAGMPWTALAVALGAAQTALVLKQKPPVMAEGGLVLGQPHSQGGTMIEAERGEFVMRRRAVEAIGIDTLNRMNEGMGGQNVNVTFQGNVMSDEFIQEEAIPKIREALRRGESLE